MTTKTSEILIDPHPRCHIVYPYADDAHIVDAVGTFAAAGLNRGEAVVVIATSDKGDLIQAHLRNQGIDTTAMEASGRLVFFDADSLLCQIMAEGSTDAGTFKVLVGGIIENARKRAPTNKVRLYGEMVNLLCGRNDLKAAARLEAWWNEIIQDYSVPLLCSYSLNLLEPHVHTGLSQQVLDAHTHIFAPA